MRAHGTHACYVWGPDPGCLPGRGCRCDDCRAAAAGYNKSLRQRVAPSYVGAARARAHVEWLGTQGVGLKRITALTGLSGGVLCKLMYGGPGNRPPARRIRKSTEDKLLAVTPADAADGASIDSAATRAAITALVERGWTKTAIAERCGQHVSNFMRFDALVSAGKARTIAALLVEPVPPRRSRWGTHPQPQPEREDPRDRARKDAEAERRAAYRSDDRPPTIDPDVFLAPWRARAACRLLDASDRWIFWPGRGDNRTVEAALAVCRTCPVQADCLAYALDAGETGIWGGTTDRQRRSLRARAAA